LSWIAYPAKDRYRFFNKFPKNMGKFPVQAMRNCISLDNKSETKQVDFRYFLKVFDWFFFFRVLEIEVSVF
jgi:hypothetical protein